MESQNSFPPVYSTRTSSACPARCCSTKRERHGVAGSIWKDQRPPAVRTCGFSKRSGKRQNSRPRSRLTLAHPNYVSRTLPNDRGGRRQRWENSGAQPEGKPREPQTRGGIQPRGPDSGRLGLKGSDRIILHTPHSLAVDDVVRVYAADREKQWAQTSMPMAKFRLRKKNRRPTGDSPPSGIALPRSNPRGKRGIVCRFNPAGELQRSFRTRGLGRIKDYEWQQGLAVSYGSNSIYVGFILTARRVQRYPG